MPTSPPAAATHRRLYMVLSPRAWSYARSALESLFRNAAEPLHLQLITDSADDARQLRSSVAELNPSPTHQWSVIAEDDLQDAEAAQFANLPNLRAFRHGHPCWRKVTDPLLLSKPGEEMVLLDPDLYFPNRFRFEVTPAAGLSLMWQRPNCLLPPEVVYTAMRAGIRLARHVDIGVSHWRNGSDLQWIDWMLGKLGGASLPRVMHVEAIVWSAIAMREGGGYLDPTAWVCWHRTQLKRIRRKLGASGGSILASEPWQTMKCFHGGGEAKWWIPEFMASHPTAGHGEAIQSTGLTPYVELTSSRFDREQASKKMLYKLGYYRVFAANSK